jgi:hypothetical protein
MNNRVLTPKNINKFLQETVTNLIIEKEQLENKISTFNSIIKYLNKNNFIRPTVGDVVRLLPGGANNTFANPPLIEGNLYVIEIDDKSNIPYQIQGRSSWVTADQIELIAIGVNNIDNPKQKQQQ